MAVYKGTKHIQIVIIKWEYERRETKCGIFMSDHGYLCFLVFGNNYRGTTISSTFLQFNHLILTFMTLLWLCLSSIFSYNDRKLQHPAKIYWVSQKHNPAQQYDMSQDVSKFQLWFDMFSFISNSENTHIIKFQSKTEYVVLKSYGYVITWYVNKSSIWLYW